MHLGFNRKATGAFPAWLFDCFRPFNRLPGRFFLLFLAINRVKTSICQVFKAKMRYLL